MGWFIFLLLYGVLSYLIGFIFGQKILEVLSDFLKAHNKLKPFLSKWGDLLFIFVIAIPILVLTTLYFWPKSETYPRSDTIQLLIFLATFFTLFYSVVIKDGPSKLRSSPKINICFEPTETDHFHRTIMQVFGEQNGRRQIIAEIPTYYLRLKIKNEGYRTLRNVEVVLEDVQPRTNKPFMSLNLNWAGYIVSDIKRSVDIPRRQSRTLDVFEFMEFSETMMLYEKLLNEPEADRYKELAEGFRSCTIKPLARSDIFPTGTYTFKLGVYADEVEPKFFKITVNYNNKWTEETTDDEMRSQHLQIVLIL